MTEISTFLLGTLAVLATPGPTNTLLAASGAVAGIRGSLRLIPAELAGYLIAIGLLSAVAGPLVAASHALATGLKLAAGLFLAWSAVGLWRAAGRMRTAGPLAPATPARVFVTTLVNPKALVFAFALFPGRDPAATVPLFAALVVSVAGGWILVGHTLGRAAGPPARISRLTALVLGAFALLVTGSALGVP